VYRFLLSPRWLGLAALVLLLATIMVGLGNWQLDRYRQKRAFNDHIDAAAATAPVDVADVLKAGEKPPTAARYTLVTAAGRYDPDHEILVRARTVDGRVGFEVVTPLVLPGGAAVLVDRGWVPPDPRSATAPPKVPPAPAGPVTVSGVVRLPEPAGGGITRRGDRLEVRRIVPARLAAELPYPLLGGYITTEQDGLVPIRVEHLGTLQNGGYAIQWWAFAALTFVGYGYLAHRRAHDSGERPDLDRAAAR
jgi:cytochrome oxidase assembly protein ShyY1